MRNGENEANVDVGMNVGVELDEKKYGAQDRVRCVRDVDGE